ncbi:hypothetical protein T484DRAFT_1895391 [Baffinella frigidus]|nr:hypothetical protein T484DRAFT_1895391 [Cryptophyta sp. CCMP2293]|mmetsp:Transcript_17229/g.41481  ORF Transcript_17229/g.41481 Transcript_17229/m.41481 type:complete len:285 (+) Transcript_17229:139-993(+)|eukprot:CAMPEP_0180147176 /NCGR_PEP_ID=MMETSP0986-20121125/19078_1 /TAXON_ID=697907 /ORGANISM="non described non described, Strain CCMP2293" /LENGTH=284 /DNA_ID=CAMNT_0022092631 /DNA_START=194 /DNA_END=1048 /DNA_ORIENTATION=+
MAPTAREKKLEEMRELGRLKEAREGIKMVRRRSSTMGDECSSFIAEYYKNMEARELSTQIKSRFDLWDADNSHTLGQHELTEALAGMGKRPTPQEVDLFMKRFDKDGTGKVNIEEYEHMVRESLGLQVEVCSCRVCESGSNEAMDTWKTMMEESSSTVADYIKSVNGKEFLSFIKTKFDSFDADHSHALDKHELKDALASMGQRPAPEEVDVLMERFDTDGNGTIDFDEFEHMVRESLRLRLEECSCRMCDAGRKGAAENAAAEDAVEKEGDMLLAKLASAALV